MEQDLAGLRCAIMMVQAVRTQLIVTTLLFASAALFGSAALHLTRLADGWTTRGIWIVGLGLAALAAAVGPWLWAQTVRSQRILLGAVLVGSGGGLLVLLPGMSYQVVMAAQATLAAAAVAESRRSSMEPIGHDPH